MSWLHNPSAPHPQGSPDSEDLEPSRSHRKREAEALQSLGQRLVELPTPALRQFGLDEKLLQACLDAQKIRSREGLRRQIQYIGKLMRQTDPAPILEKFAVREGTSREHTARMHLAERWRERLLAADAAFEEFLAEHPGVDHQPLRAAIRAARRERAEGLAPKNQRSIYKTIIQALEAADPLSADPDPSLEEDSNP